MKRLFILLPLALLAGCARYPSTPSNLQPKQQLTMELTVAGQINQAYYYFFAIDTNGDPADGPVPLVITPSLPLPATGAPLIISDRLAPPSDWVVFHAGSFQHYRNGVFVGPPFRYTLPNSGANTLTMTLDRATLANPSVAGLELNFVTADRLIPPDDPLALLDTDGLGPRGDEFVAVPTDTNAVYDNAQAAVPEGPGDVADDDLDLVDWRVEVRNE